MAETGAEAGLSVIDPYNECWWIKDDRVDKFDGVRNRSLVNLRFKSGELRRSITFCFKTDRTFRLGSEAVKKMVFFFFTHFYFWKHRKDANIIYGNKKKDVVWMLQTKLKSI